MSQIAINDAPARAYEGMQNNRAERTVSGIASELIYFGKAVSVVKNTNLSSMTPPIKGYTSGEVLLGIAPADPSVERLASAAGVIDQAAAGAFSAATSVPVVRRGQVWVKSADAINDITKSVFVKNADTAGTAASVTDTTTYSVADQDGKTSIITIAGYAPQTVLFAGSTTTAASVASQMNAQLVGCSVTVVGGQVKITTDAVGSAVTIAAAAGTGALTWDTPVAGAGDIAVLAQNARGSFRGTSASGYTEFGAGTGLKWIASDTINGAYYGLLEINLP